MPESKILLYGNDAQSRLKDGIDAVAKMVKVTLGPKGRNVILDRSYGGPLVTKDGVTVAKEIFLKDPVANMGAQLMKEAASKTADVAGDGTTTATVLAQAIIVEGTRCITGGASPMNVKRGIDEAVRTVVENLHAMARPVSTPDEIVQVGTISANGDLTLGKLIAEAMDEVGQEGVITVEDGKDLTTTLETVEGMQFDRGYLSPYFISNPERMNVELQKVSILLYSGRLTNLADITQTLNKIVQDGGSLLVLADEIDGDALKTLILNKVRGSMKSCAVKAPGFGDRRKDILEDIAILTGGTVINEEVGKTLKNIVLADLGTAEKVVVTKDNTTVVNGAGNKDAITSRVDQIKTMINTATSDYDKQRLQERLAKLVGGVAVLRVGAATDAELKEKKARIEDALHATRAAVEEGIVPGGGVALIRASQSIPTPATPNSVESADRTMGMLGLIRSCLVPAKSILENGGYKSEVIVDAILKSSEVDYGYNAQSGAYENFYTTGIVDPVKVVRTALENAASIAGAFITTEGAVADSPEYKEEKENLMAQGQGM
jgi:chaperonin GroEL